MSSSGSKLHDDGDGSRPVVSADSDFQDGFEDDEEESVHEISNSSEDNEEEEGEKDEINDAGLLRSMVRDTKDFYVALAAAGQSPASEDKQCWVCFACEEDDPDAEWTHPCRCRGTTKWVHQACIQRWIDEKQRGNTSTEVHCPQCGTTYTIRFPKANFLILVLDSTDKLYQKVCPIIVGAACVGSLYWTCVTFGAVTLMQVVGEKRGLNAIEFTDPLILLVTLPLVPVALVIGKMIRWEEPVLTFLRTTVPRIPLSRYVLPSFAIPPEELHFTAAGGLFTRGSCGGSPRSRSLPQGPPPPPRRNNPALPPLGDNLSMTRTFCGALFFPSIAAFLGSALFGDVESRLKRTILGGLTYVAVKGVVRIYHRQHTYIRQCQRIILDHHELPPSA